MAISTGEPELVVSQETLKGKPGKHRCPDCSYSAMTAGSLKGHIAMAHPAAVPAHLKGVAASPSGAASVLGGEAHVDELVESGHLVKVGDQLIPATAMVGPDAIASMGDGDVVAAIVPIDSIEVASNVREDLGELSELAASIREHGLLQPITLTAGVGVPFRVLEGHRRLAAAKLAGLTTIRALLDSRAQLGDGAERVTLQLVENVQRSDLNAIDVAQALKAILDARPDLTQADVAKWVGKDRSWVSNALRLLETAPEVQEAVRTDKISATHARAIAGVDVDLQPRLLESVVDRGISAHETENQAKYFKDQAKQIRERAAKVETTAAKVIALLEKVANAKTATVGLADYAGSGPDLRAAIGRAGWTVADGWGFTKVANAGECGCAGVWRAEIGYDGKIALSPACNNDEHAAARKAALDERWKVDQAKANDERRAEREALEAASIRVKSTVAEILATRPLTTLARRLITWGLIAANEDPDEVLVAKYLGGVGEAIYEMEDVAWALVEAIPDEDLDDVQARAVSGLFGSYLAGATIKAAVEAWSTAAHPETLELAEPEAAGKRERKRLGKDLRLADPVVIGPDEYLVIGIIHGPFDAPSIVELGIKGPVKAVDYRLHRVPLADLTADTKERVWRAPQAALQVVTPSKGAAAPVDEDDAFQGDQDLRPTGEVNADALRGEADRSIVDEAE